MSIFGDPEIVKTKIMEYLEFNEKEYNTFITALKKHNAVIAGSFVLSCFSDFKPNDIDIYITNKDMMNFPKKLPGDLSPVSLDFISKYDSLGKKYVMRMLFYKYKNYKPYKNISMDVVIVDDSYTIDQVIDNFDLSFCKIWFDGDNVYATHPNDIKTKSGSLNKIYTNQYYNAIEKGYESSDLICSRNKKYTERGFKIKIDKKPTTLTVSDDESAPVLVSNKFTHENHVIKMILQNFTNNCITKYLIDDISSYSKYISKYIGMFYYTQDYDPILYIKKITLFKFYFISMFKEFTFDEYIKNLNKFFKNITLKTIYKIALYSLEEYLYFVHDINIHYDFDNYDMKFTYTNGGAIKSLTPTQTSVVRFIIDNKLNRYEDYRFTRYIDSSYIKLDNPVLHDKLIDIDYIEPEKLREILQIKKKCIKLITKQDVKDYLEKSKLTGFDLINCEQDVNISKYLSENKENIILVVLSKDIPSITCISKKDLDSMISDINDNWFYDCDLMNNPKIFASDIMQTVHYKENYYLLHPYIKVPLAAGTFYIEYNYIYSLFMSKHQVFFVYPKYNLTRSGSKVQEEIVKSVSFKNTKYGISKGIANYVSANHCQDGSNIKLYEIKSLKLDTKKSIKKVKSSAKTSSPSTKSSSTRSSSARSSSARSSSARSSSAR
jgi:hypothetical protein